MALSWRHRIITYYINLEHRTDRRQQIENELITFQFHDWTRFDAICNTERGDVGCSQSHLAVLKLARTRFATLSFEVDYVLILEDDFEFVITPEVLEEAMQQFFEFPHRVDGCLLAFLAEKDDAQELENGLGLQRIRFAQTASAYLIRRDYVSTLITLYETSIPLLQQTGAHWLYMNDQVWKSLMETDAWYRFAQRLGRQRESYSDLAKRIVKYDG